MVIFHSYVKLPEAIPVDLEVSHIRRAAKAHMERHTTVFPKEFLSSSRSAEGSSPFFHRQIGL